MSSEPPLVSIIIPLYNREHFITETLHSVIEQEYESWEAIVVDDGSTDASTQLVDKIIKTDNRIKFFVRERSPKGASTCRNIGIERARGKYIMFLDSDDLLARNCLSQRVTYFQQNEGSDFLVFPQIVFDVDRRTLHLWNLETDEPDLYRFLKIDGVWCISGPIYKAGFLKEIAGFNENLSCWQDLDIATKSLMHSGSYEKLYHLNADVYIRVHAHESVSQLGLDSQTKMHSRAKLFREIVQSNYRFSDPEREAIKVTYFLVLYLCCFRFGDLDWAQKEMQLLYTKKFINRVEKVFSYSLFYVLHVYHGLSVNRWIYQKTVNFYGKIFLRKLIKVQTRVAKEEKIVLEIWPPDLLKYARTKTDMGQFV